MKLRKIELQGFKSFRQKTGFPVSPGITAVVGPNGCRKSNIVDAIRWAMGTQSARALRGSEMADVIFAGSGGRKPAGFSEVTLTFENEKSNNTDPVDDIASSPLRTMVASASTLSIGRRLYRSGDATYLINSSPVRLKDVQEVFLGTGASVRGYSIIEQGQIDFLVNARPSERRTFVEELAGVTRYRFHRKETQQKMTSTKVNLERLDDIIDEVKKRINQLKRQAQLAKRHQKLASHRKQLELYLLIERRQGADQTRAKTNKKLEKLESARKKHLVALSKVEVEEARLEKTVTTRDETLKGFTEDKYRIQAQRDLLLQSVEHANNEQESLAAERERIAEDEKELTTELETITARIVELLKELSAEPENDPEDEQYESRVTEAAAVVASSERVLDRSEGDLRNIVAKRAQTQSAERSNRAESGRLTARLSGQSERFKALEVQIGRTEERDRLLSAKLDTLRAAVSSRNDDCAVMDRKVEDCRADIEHLRPKLDAVAQSLASRQAQKQLKIEASAASSAEAVEAVMRASQAGELKGVHQVVADGLVVPEDLDGALFGVLRHLLGYIVVDSPSAAIAVINFANRHELVVGCIEARANEDPGVQRGGLFDRVQVADWIPPVIRQMLAAAYLVDSLDEAETQAGGFTVDLSGNCTTQSGFWHSSDTQGGAFAERARLQRELVELDQQINSLTKDRAALEGLSGQRGTDLKALLHEQRDARVRHGEAKDDLAGGERELAAVRAEIQGARAQLADHRNAVESDEIRLAELAAETKSTAKQLAAVHKELEACELERADALVRLDKARKDLSAAQQVMAERRERVRQRIQRRKAVQAEHERCATAKSSATRRIGRIDERRKQIGEALARREYEVEANQKTADEMSTELTSIEGRLVEARADLEGVRGDLLAKTTEGRQMRKTAVELSTEVERLVLHREQAEQEIARADQELSAQQGFDQKAAREFLETFSAPEDAEAALHKVRSDIEKLGPVNHAAVEELDEADERHTFLCGQRGDLTRAMTDMRATIDELDRASREAFLSTFQDLRAQFEGLFTRLFQGGEATLALTDETDPLTAGVEVFVAPPGKKVKSMTLLSGGEKALTAIAMVFSAFRLKPSPFCVLDEVDAPLDDANIERFVDLLRELSAETQFLVVTHNRRTMECGNALVGVTMEEPGCSRLVGVSLPSGKNKSTSSEDDGNLRLF